jgi:tRNA(adenine34) deaminase
MQAKERVAHGAGKSAGLCAHQKDEGGTFVRTTNKKKRWVATVKTDSTHPPAGLFTKDAATIARVLASKRVSPKGVGSGMRMLSYFINRAGRNLNAKRRAELTRAKALLAQKVRKRRSGARLRSARLALQ